jgi:hypothetical protein
MDEVPVVPRLQERRQSNPNPRMRAAVGERVGTLRSWGEIWHVFLTA